MRKNCQIAQFIPRLRGEGLLARFDNEVVILKYIITMKGRFNKFVSILSGKLPGFNVKFKNESLLMKIIGKILFFNKTFMTEFITTIGYTVYFPNNSYIDGSGYGALAALAALAHEYRHAKDSSKITRVLFGVLYLIPQFLALPGLLSIFIFVPLLIFGVISWSWWMLIIMLMVLFMAPWPAYYRTQYEINGYIMSLFIINELQKERGIDTQSRNRALILAVSGYNKNFINSNYYYMWPFGVEKKLFSAVGDIMSENIFNTNPIYKEVFEALKESNV
jgi:hypothetical protein